MDFSMPKDQEAKERQLFDQWKDDATWFYVRDPGLREIARALCWDAWKTRASLDRKES